MHAQVEARSRGDAGRAVDVRRWGLGCDISSLYFNINIFSFF